MPRLMPSSGDDSCHVWRMCVLCSSSTFAFPVHYIILIFFSLCSSFGGKIFRFRMCVVCIVAYTPKSTIHKCEKNEEKKHTPQIQEYSSCSSLRFCLSLQYDATKSALWYFGTQQKEVWFLRGSCRVAIHICHEPESIYARRKRNLIKYVK